MHTYSFEKLQVWHLAQELVIKAYTITTRFGMVSQMRRAAISICSNLAEGSGRNTTKDQRHFYGMAYGSLMELLNQLIIAEAWIGSDELSQLRPDIDAISIKINSLRKSIKE